MPNRIRKHWEDFCIKMHLSVNTPYEAFSFGNTAEMADVLAALVNKGIKRATTSAYDLYEMEERLPEVGEYSIILNGKEEAVCVIQTKRVYITPYNLITAEYAWLEGEGDRSYSFWQTAHDTFFEEEYKKAGKKFYSHSPMVCEIFEKIFSIHS